MLNFADKRSLLKEINQEQYTTKIRKFVLYL